MPVTGHNKRSAARVIGIDSYLVLLAVTLGMGAAAVADETDTTGPKILLLRGTHSSELDLATRLESGDTDVDNRPNGDNRSPDEPVRLPSPANNGSSTDSRQLTILDSTDRQPPVSIPTQSLPEGLVSEPLRNFWTPGKDVIRPAWHGRAIPASNRTGSEIQATSYISESLPRPHFEATPEKPHVATPPHELSRAEERDSPIPHLLLSISLVTSIVALGLAIAFRASGLRRDATIHVELAGPHGHFLAAAPSARTPTSAPEAVPARATTIADFADSQFAAASLLGPTFDDRRHADEQRQRAQESAILETLFEENLRLRQDLRKPAAVSSAASEI